MFWLDKMKHCRYQGPSYTPLSDRIYRSEIRLEYCPTELFGRKFGRSSANIYLVEGMAIRSENCDQIHSIAFFRSQFEPLFVVSFHREDRGIMSIVMHLVMVSDVFSCS